MKQLIIIGAGGHGKVVADIAEKMGYDRIQFLDDDQNVMDCNGWPVVGRAEDFMGHEGDFIVAIGNAKIRAQIQNRLDAAGKKIATLIHPSAVIGKNVMIKKGTVVMAGTVINSGTQIGMGCIVNTCASVDHDCMVDDFVHVSVGAHVAGGCEIGECTCVGAGATIVNNIHICSACVIGSGAVVIRNIEEKGTYIGCPARKM